MFSPTDIDAAVAQVFALNKDIPADKQGATLLAADQDGVKVVLATKLTPTSNWTVSAIVDHPWAGGLQYGVYLSEVW